MNIKDLVNIEQIRSKLNYNSFLYNNLFVVNFIPIGSKVKNIFNKDIAFLTNSITQPGCSFTTLQAPYNGRTINRISGYDTHNLGMTLYNFNGEPFEVINNWANIIYNKESGVYEYPNNTIIDVQVIEFSKAGVAKVEHNYMECNLISYGSATLQYGEATEVSVVTIEIDYRTYLAKTYT